jgi:hypothetical protein
VVEMKAVAGPPLRPGARTANKYTEVIRDTKAQPGQWFELEFPTQRDALSAQGSLRRRNVPGLRMTRQMNVLYIIYEAPAKTKLAAAASG